MNVIIVLMDIDRLDALKVNRTCRTEDSKRKWSLNERTFKFVVLPNNKLVIGPLRDHIELYATYETWSLPINEALAQILTITRDLRNCCRDTLVIGAGTVSATGEVTSWKSDGFGVETPQSMRDDLEKVIIDLIQHGPLATA